MMHFVISFGGVVAFSGAFSCISQSSSADEVCSVFMENNIIPIIVVSEIFCQTIIFKVKNALCLIWISYAVSVTLSCRASGAFLPSCFVTDSAQSVSYQTRCPAVALFLSARFAASSGFVMLCTLHLHCLGKQDSLLVNNMISLDKYLNRWLNNPVHTKQTMCLVLLFLFCIKRKLDVVALVFYIKPNLLILTMEKVNT